MAAESHWPTAFVDVDRRFVTFSGSFFVHRARKEALAFFQMGRIMVDAGKKLNPEDEQLCRREPIM